MSELVCKTTVAPSFRVSGVLNDEVTTSVGYRNRGPYLFMISY